MYRIDIPKTINPDIAIERKNASFDSNEMAVWFYGGKEIVDLKRTVESELYMNLDDPLEYHFVSYEDLASLTAKTGVAAARKLKAIQERISPGGSEIFTTFMDTPYSDALMPAGNPWGVHMLMFRRILKNQCTPDIYEKFGRRAENCEIVGTYAQTELGHGTYLKGLEARADYDRQTQEFILNTPTMTSYKWWPGGLGHYCNYCIFVAQLYIDSESKGMQMFIVQVRDEETHMPLPGVHVGEIGKRWGMNGANNGFLGLKNYRVPRTNMLMKHQQVLPDGTFIKSPVSQLSYFPMVYVRCRVALNNTLYLAQAVTIASRYSVIRRQSPIEEGALEPKIIEHLTQQMKIIPEIANVVVHFRAAQTLYRLYEETAEAVNRMEFSRLPELHALACILKVTCSYDSTSGVERLRQACGGHGYLAAANLGNLFSIAAAGCTYEGENSVLYLQVGKILMKVWADVLAGKKLMPTMAYLSECSKVNFPPWRGTWECILKALQFTSTGATRIAYKRYSSRLREGESPSVATNNTALELTKAAELHGRAFIASNFYEEVSDVGRKNRHSPEFQKVLENLLELYLIQTFFRHSGDILRFISIAENEISALQERLQEVLKKLRPDVVALTDGFDIHDRLLNSVLGCYDGNAYERLFDAALRSPLNKKPVPDFFHQHLKPFMKENAEGAHKSKL